MPVKRPPKERPLIEMFLSEYEDGEWRDACLDWPEESKDGAVEVIAKRRADAQTVAIEHTIVQPFAGEKAESHMFMQAFGRIENNADLVMPERRMNVLIPVGAISRPYNWEKVGADLLTWLKAEHAKVPTNAETCYMVPVAVSSKQGPLQLPIRVLSMRLPGSPGLTTIGHETMPETLKEVVCEALQRKLPKLVGTIADRRILLLERQQVGFGSMEIIWEIEALAPKFPELREIQEFWIAETWLQASEGWVYFCRFDGRGLVESMHFEHGALRCRQNSDESLGPPRCIGESTVI